MATSHNPQPQQMGQSQPQPAQPNTARTDAQPAQMQAQMGQTPKPVFTDFASI
jgi:hypothetical protein